MLVNLGPLEYLKITIPYTFIHIDSPKHRRLIDYVLQSQHFAYKNPSEMSSETHVATVFTSRMNALLGFSHQRPIRARR